MSDRNWIILLVLIVVVYLLLEKKSYPSHPLTTISPAPKRSEPWSQIHLDFTESYLVNQWQQLGCDYQETQKWIKWGVKPNEPKLVQWIKGVRGLDLKDIGQTSNSINHLRNEWKISQLPPGTEGYY